MIANTNPETGIAYGYISANTLHPDIVQTLQDNGTDVYYEDAKEEAQKEAAREWVTKLTAAGVLELDLLYDKETSSMVYDPAPLDEDALFELALKKVKSDWDGSDWEQAFNDSYQPDEPIHEGTHMIGDGNWVKYRTSWLGGALNIFITESPFVTETARECSLCVPNAGNLDQVGEGHYKCYDVPPDWRDTE